ncbi:hypothetical protein [Actinocrispum sp. NPDC049592]|uniref:hypothetical protein n=1 Tax=Actinocrispum sp. NPDC049592 TaxID=3154835 RepID=UPI003418D3FF
MAVGLPAVIIVWTTISRSITHDEDELPRYSSDLLPACKHAGTAYSTAAAYTGPAPHPIVVLESLDDSGANWWSLGGLRGSAGAESWDSLQVAEVQLVACVQRTATGAVVASCPYKSVIAPGSTAPPTVLTMRAADYQVTVYELRTHHEVGKLTVPGTDNSCPPYERISIGSNDKSAEPLYAQLTPPQLRTTLTPYLSRSA